MATMTMTPPKNAIKTHKVTLVFPSGNKKVLNVKENEYISDVAITEGIKLPSSCNAGVCVTCTAKLVEGSIIHDHTFLKPKEEEAGFLLTCRTFVTSDCVILTNQEDALLDM
ncbi:2Fe-2S iron-sulfur cluster-binding protein [Geminocystis sp. GBBB08]|uniref:2Fe-2S iron-sulfur cluster-binding protein n=1 Tax=Geminocystis sp. GBBB08 TaxID=2604140 RepID=UPI0027E2B6D4|nr:2Fe-2S iron-sulfur cluster-binding protein [Geminocystis sp. GBBB08]